MLNDYLKTVQGWIRDRAQKDVDPEDLIRYINRARREIALRTQCVRILSPIQGQITAIQLTAGGKDYTNPVVTITPPDSPSGRPIGLGGSTSPAGVQATATAQMIGGTIVNISMTNGGDGYFEPAVTISDPTGTGATAIARITPISTTVGTQEVYPFSMIPLQYFAGVKEVFAVKSVSFIYANYRYSLPCYPFSVYQALIRQYPQQYQYVPTMCAQYGQGSNGSLYFYPLPSTAYQFELDCFCLPADLLNDDMPEAIADPWTDAIPIGAVVYAMEEMQSYNNARYWQAKFDEYVHRYSSYARPGRMINPYGRY